MSNASLEPEDAEDLDLKPDNLSTQLPHIGLEGLELARTITSAPSREEKEAFGENVQKSQGCDKASLSGELVDNVTMPDLATLQDSTLNDTMPSAILGTVAPKTVAADKRKSPSRVARRQRREAEGTYRLAALERRKQEIEAARIEKVLDKIESLDGPSVARKVQEKPLDRTEKSKSSEKKKQQGAMKTHQDLKRDDKTSSKTKKERWQIQKSALERKFGETGWQPRKRLSPDALDGIRALHASDPELYCTEALAENFKVSPEAIRRILKAKWKPNEAEIEDRRLRWVRRGVKKWQALAESGMRPPAKWRAMGVGTPNGVKDDRVPKRKKPKSKSNLSWDDVVADIDPDNPGLSISERLL